MSTADPVQWFRRVRYLPRRFRGQEAVVTVRLAEAFDVPWDFACQALDLPIGETLVARVTLTEEEDLRFLLYVTGEMAERVMDLAAGTLLTAKVRVLFGVSKSVEFSDEGPILRLERVSGLLLVELISAAPAGEG